MSEDELVNIVKGTSNSYCDLDPIPTSLLKKVISCLAPVLIKIVNTSLQKGEVPACMKHAIVQPRLKKDGLPHDDVSSYRPIANLSFVGKLVERVVARQIREYLADHDLLPSAQSAYREHFSVETALLRVQNDLLMALDARQDAVLVLLDFSAAFDTIDHDLLLERMESYFGIRGRALRWFSSYLENRTHVVMIKKNASSQTYHDKHGVPQGSVIGPLAFTMYTAPMEDIITSHGVNVMLYADDTQMYIVFKPSEREESLEKLKACITDVKIWAMKNKLSLNDSKTEVIHFTSKFRRDPTLSSVYVGDCHINPVPCARNLGVVFDQHITLKEHIKTVCKSAMAGIRCISKIRCFLSKQGALTLVHAFVTSRLDSCNSLLFGLPAIDIHRIQMIQNIAARLVTRTPHQQSIN